MGIEDDDGEDDGYFSGGNHSSPDARSSSNPSPKAAGKLTEALAKLRQVDGILEQLSLFWANTEVVLDTLTKKGQHVEQFVGFSSKPRLMARFMERIEEYKRFWEGIAVMCSTYINGLQQHQQEQGHPSQPHQAQQQRHDAGAGSMYSFLDSGGTRGGGATSGGSAGGSTGGAGPDSAQDYMQGSWNYTHLGVKPSGPMDSPSQVETLSSANSTPSSCRTASTPLGTIPGATPGITPCSRGSASCSSQSLGSNTVADIALSVNGSSSHSNNSNSNSRNNSSGLPPYPTAGVAGNNFQPGLASTSPFVPPTAPPGSSGAGNRR